VVSNGHMPPMRFGILSSALPTPCGIATFSRALGTAMERAGATVGVVRVLDQPEATLAEGLTELGTLVPNDPTSIDCAAAALNTQDVAIIQHEFGLYGGPDGEDVVSVMERLTVPAITVMHTVLRHPTPHQREVADAVLALSDEVVVMTEAAQQILERSFAVDVTRVSLIPHGASVITDMHPRAKNSRPRLLTWGLIGPGKGIERVLDALMTLTDVHPRPLYVVAGRTHPKVLAHSGDAYRNSLVARAELDDVRDMVHFDDSYRTLPSLQLLIESADVIILPYDSVDQATSGVLVDAIAAGRPVIATAFPHAVELLRTGAGIIVEHNDVGALSAALRRVLTEPGLADKMAAEAARIAPSLSWDHIASQYAMLARAALLGVGAAS
jgi:polysaccharide biosynthesis protein PslF